MPSSLCIHACRLEEVRQSVLSTHLFATHRPTHHSVRVLVPCMPISHYYKSNYIHWNLGKYISITVMLIVLRLSFVFLSSFFPLFSVLQPVWYKAINQLWRGATVHTVRVCLISTLQSARYPDWKPFCSSRYSPLGCGHYQHR